MPRHSAGRTSVAADFARGSKDSFRLHGYVRRGSETRNDVRGSGKMFLFFPDCECDDSRALLIQPQKPQHKIKERAGIHQAKTAAGNGKITVQNGVSKVAQLVAFRRLALLDRNRPRPAKRGKTLGTKQ